MRIPDFISAHSHIPYCYTDFPLPLLLSPFHGILLLPSVMGDRESVSRQELEPLNCPELPLCLLTEGKDTRVR